MSEFEVLERLANEGDCAVRVHQVAEDVHLSQSALSRVIRERWAASKAIRALQQELGTVAAR